ncbi:MAG: LamG-like jellyroll fold domain-containing protein [Minisyncoccales bacterium]
MNKQKSFTLIELLVVIVIIGILAGVIMISTSSSIDKANIAKVKVFEESVQNNLAINMVSRWPLDDNGSIAKDLWGGNDGTLYNNPTWKGNNECVSGGCLSFNGTDNYIGLQNAVSFTYNDFTISWWMKRTKSRYECIFASKINNSSGQIEVDRILNTIRFESYTNNIFQYNEMTTNLNLSDGRWHNFVIASSPTEFALYSDGIKTYTTSPNTDTKNQVFGWIGVQQLQVTYIYGDYFTGLIDDIKMYNAALSSSQIKQNYIAGLNSMLSNGNISKEDYNERINNLAYNDNNE